MGWWQAIPVIGNVVSGLFKLIDKQVENKDEANALKAQLEQILLSSDLKKFQTDIEARAGIILAEAKGQSWMQRNWRPCLMMTIVLIIANNYLLFPYASMFFPESVTILELPDALYNLMTVGVGGYIVGRSAEKGITSWKDGK